MDADQDTPTTRGYAARRLSLNEWQRREAELPYPPGAIVPDENKRLIVVEDGHGRIVASWVAMNVVVLEGAFIHPEHRHGPVVKHLLVEMITQLLEAEVPGALTIINDELVAQLAHRIGFRSIPGKIFQVDLRPAAPSQESR